MHAPIERADADPLRAQWDGLTDPEAASRLETGANELPQRAPLPLYRRLLAQLREPMALLLLAAAAVSWLGLGERVDAAAIVAIVAANVFVALLQEGKARRALESLREMESPAATVRRGGVLRRVPAREIVPGDVVVLTAGDRVPADLVIVESTTFEVDESLLTGESLPVGKSGDDGAYSGTLVMRGTATGVITATGPLSRLGRIAASLDTPEQETPLQRELRSLSARLGLIAAGIAGVVFAATLWRLGASEGGVETSFLSAAALAVAAVPEGLPTVVTVALALGVRRMAAHRAIVRKLPAVETLGSTTVILTDKTGTLTENRMRVDLIAVKGRPPLPLSEHVTDVEQRVQRVLALANDATLEPPTGDPMEVALAEAVGADLVRELRSRQPRLASVPFDADRRLMSSSHQSDGHVVLLVKGAPEAVLTRCVRILTSDGTVTALDDTDRAEILRMAAELAGRGARVLALADRSADSGSGPDIPESDLTLLGLISLRDPVRAEAADAVRVARSAGVRVVMVTGDHPGTAMAIAVEAGIAEPGSRAVIGTELSDRDAPDIDNVSVYARVLPEQKLQLVRAFQDAGHVVAVTGDGVNDAPALRRADIGVAMGGSGSDVARETADMVVTDDNLATIVTAIDEGRGIYDNIQKVVAYLVAGNLSEILVVVAGLVFFPGLGVPLLPLQLLWINLLTDGLPALALGVDPVDESLMRQQPRSRERRLLDGSRMGMLSWRAVVIAAATMAGLTVARYSFDEPWDHARAIAFSVLVTAHLLYAFAVRRLTGGRARTPNHWLRAAVVSGLSLQLLIVTVPGLRRVFGTAHLTLREWVLVLTAGVLPTLVMAVSRRFVDQSARRSPRPAAVS